VPSRACGPHWNRRDGGVARAVQGGEGAESGRRQGGSAVREGLGAPRLAFREPAITTSKMLLIGSGWFGIQVFWAFHAGPLPLFLRDFTESKFSISLVLSLAGLSGCIVPPLVGYWSDRSANRFGRRRPFVLLGALGVALCVLALPHATAFTAVTMLAGCSYFMLRAAETPFLSLLPDVTPPEQRSTASGVMNLVGSLGLIGCFAMSTLLWEHHRTAVFRVAALAFFGSLLLSIARLKEPSAPAPAPGSRRRPSPLRYLRSILAETSAMRFFTAQFFWWLGFWMVSTFATLFAVEELRAAEGQSFLVLLPFTVVATLFMLPMGMLGDRFGRRAILSVMIFVWAVTQVLVGLSQNLTQAVVLVAASAVPFATVMGVGYAYMLDLVPQERTAEFVGFSVISIAVAQILGPLIGGRLIDGLGYRAIFPAAALLMIVGLAILQFVRPRAAPLEAAARFGESPRKEPPAGQGGTRRVP
jgi:maltose/moltooligosaccharide transporter